MLVTGVSCNKANYFLQKSNNRKNFGAFYAILMTFHPRESRFGSLSTKKVTEKIRILISKEKFSVFGFWLHISFLVKFEIFCVQFEISIY